MQKLTEEEKEMAIEDRKAMYVVAFSLLSEMVFHSVLGSLIVFTTLDGEMNLTVYHF